MEFMLTKMTAEEFVKKIMVHGERDLSNIYIEDADLTPYIPDLNKYLRSQDLEKEPVNLSRSVLKGLKADRIYLPHVVGEFLYANGAKLNHAKLNHAKLNFAKLNFAELNHAR